MNRTLPLAALLFFAGLGTVLVVTLGTKMIVGYVHDTPSSGESIWPFFAALAYTAFTLARTITFITDKES